MLHALRTVVRTESMVMTRLAGVTGMSMSEDAQSDGLISSMVKRFSGSITSKWDSSSFESDGRPSETL